MRPEKNGTLQRGRNVNRFDTQGPNWVLIAGGALLGTLSIRLVCKLKQAFEAKRSTNESKGIGKGAPRRGLGACQSHANFHPFAQLKDRCCNCKSGLSGGSVESKTAQEDADLTLPLVNVSAVESIQRNGVMWESSPDRLELQPKPFHRSNSSDSPCFSESGSDIYTKREVIQKLRRQLKRRDEMILEMQEQIANLQSSLSVQMNHSANLQSQIDSVTRDLLDSEREIQRLRRVIANNCVAEADAPEMHVNLSNRKPGSTNGHMNGYLNSVLHVETNGVGVEKGQGDEERVEMLKKEIGELREVIEGKDFLLQSYKEQKIELCAKIKDMQLRLDSQMPSIL